MISNQGRRIDPANITTIEKWHDPKNIKQVYSFFGLAGYYRRFIHHYAAIADPLTDLLRREAFVWTNNIYTYFETLNSKLSYTPIFTLPYLFQEFKLKNDASGQELVQFSRKRGLQLLITTRN